MNNTIDFTVPVRTVVKEHPEIVAILVDFGFEPLTDHAILNTVGRLVSLNQGAKKIGASAATLAQQLEWNGYDVKGVAKNG